MSKKPHSRVVMASRRNPPPPLIEFPLRRLREAGANTLQLKLARSSWDKMGEVEREAEAARIAATPVEELRAALDRDREESEDSSVVIDTTRVPRMTVREVLAWVGDDARRARAALDEESRRPPAERRTSLLERLERKARR